MKVHSCGLTPVTQCSTDSICVPCATFQRLIAACLFAAAKVEEVSITYPSCMSFSAAWVDFRLLIIAIACACHLG